jgi:hypothetical protein
LPSSNAGDAVHKPDLSDGQRSGWQRPDQRLGRYGRVEPVCPGIALEDDDLPIVIECDSKVPGVATQPCILEFFDLARVEKFKRRWARGERLQGSHELARRRYRKVFQ